MLMKKRRFHKYLIRQPFIRRLSRLSQRTAIPRHLVSYWVLMSYFLWRGEMDIWEWRRAVARRHCELAGGFYETAL